MYWLFICLDFPGFTRQISVLRIFEENAILKPVVIRNLTIEKLLIEVLCLRF